MTNHVHLLIQVGDVPLSRIIQNLGFRYTRYINIQDLEGVSMTSLATELNRDLSSVSRAATRLRKRMAGDDQLRLKGEKILRVIQPGALQKAV